MNIHEYQAKSLLRDYGVAVPSGEVANTPREAKKIAEEVRETTGCTEWAVKAQIHAGGRGKGGGIRIAGSPGEAGKHAREIIGMKLVTPQTGPGGKKVGKVLVEQSIYYPGENETSEFYISILPDRSLARNVIIYSTEGGVEIEAVAKQNPELIFREVVDPGSGLLPFQARRIAFRLGLKGDAFRRMTGFVMNLYNAYMGSDASLIEINPLFKTSDNMILAADTKMILDDNALFRHPDYKELRDVSEEEPSEVEAGRHGLNFIKLDGNVGCMVNGAGLAMATMDMIMLSGGNPANFLDVGGTANAKAVEAGFRIILKDPNVKIILINIFGGIVRCDRVARGVVDAYRAVGGIRTPVIVRLQGTNAEEGKKIIDRSVLKVNSALTLREASGLVAERL